jgi:hypothetical protein
LAFGRRFEGANLQIKSEEIFMPNLKKTVKFGALVFAALKFLIKFGGKIYL